MEPSRNLVSGALCAAVALVAILAGAPASASDAVGADPVRLAGAAPARSGDALAEHLGVEVGGGRMSPVLKAGRTCPCERTIHYSTAVDDQTEIPIVLLRGTGTEPGRSSPVAALMVRGVEKAPAGRGHVEVTLTVDGADLLVSAVDAKTGRVLELAVGTPASAR